MQDDAEEVRARGGVESGSWSLERLFVVALLFVASGVAEIGGGWLVWQFVRENKPVSWAVGGSLVLGNPPSPPSFPSDPTGHLAFSCIRTGSS